MGEGGFWISFVFKKLSDSVLETGLDKFMTTFLWSMVFKMPRMLQGDLARPETHIVELSSSILMALLEPSANK